MRDIDGVTAKLFAKMSPKPDNDVYASEVAIIAFWKLDADDELKCYRHFTIPNPMKREIRRNDSTDATIAQVLYQNE